LIDGVLSAPLGAAATANAAGLTSLTKALSNADLVSAVESAKDITIFAPTNAAFAAAGATLAKLSDKQVADALKYHVVTGLGYSTGLKDRDVLPTLNGGKLTVSIKNGAVFVNGAKVVKADVLVKQGVVHVIDSVLVPK
jgi:uncharacterized surface protein with fasciclin (FAS1) repeats